jgi:hypothetical protein
MDYKTTLFCQIICHPHIVVPGEKMNRNSGISNAGESAQETSESPGDNKLIFPPEIEDITQEPDLFRIGCCFIKPFDYLLFALNCRAPGIKSKMKIRSEIYLILFTE